MNHEVKCTEMNYICKSFSELSAQQLYEILKARSQVFIVEKNMRCLDMDDADYVAYHYFLEKEEKVVAYLRAISLDDKRVKIGRVLTTLRGKGYGREILAFAISDIKKRFGAKQILLHAQTDVALFYEKCGFEVVSDEFMEENVPHVEMLRNI